MIDNGDAERRLRDGTQLRRLATSDVSNYTNNLKRFGYTDEAMADGGSQALVDEIVPQGSAEQVRRAVRAHLDAGADHVCVQTLPPAGFKGVPADDWRAVAAARPLRLNPPPNRSNREMSRGDTQFLESVPFSGDN